MSDQYTLPTIDPVTGADLSNLPRFTVGANPLPVESLPSFGDSLVGAIAPAPSRGIINQLTGLDGGERFQTWPERMIRSGVSLPGDVYSGAESIVDPETGRTSEKIIERAQDTASLTVLGTLGIKPGTATVGSGPIRKLTELETQNKLKELKTIFKENGANFDALPKELQELFLNTDKKITPVSYNPFAELEQGIRETARNISRERTTNPTVPETTAKEFEKINDIALSFVDKWNPKARENRASAQGFEQEAFHGTTSDFENLAINAKPGYGFYSTANPKLADLYASGQTDAKLLPLKINTKEYKVVDAKGQNWEFVNNEAIREAMAENKKGVVIHNVYDHPSGSKAGPQSTVFISLDPATVKSKFAKFDLEKLGLNDLLASGAAILLGGEAMKLIPVDGNPFEQKQ